jgi:hypothetical protein
LEASAASASHTNAEDEDEDEDEEDLGVFDLDLVAQTFPEISLAAVLAAEHRFMLADEDKSGVRRIISRRRRDIVAHRMAP